jgi:Ulp1 family protease
VDIFDLDLLLIPCHGHGNHWTCVAVNFRLKQVQYYDSTGSNGDLAFKHTRQYLSEEHKEKNSVAIDFEGWADVMLNGPLQENGNDCGVLICQAMENLARGMSRPFEFNQKDVVFLRKSMALHIGDGRLPFLLM